MRTRSGVRVVALVVLATGCPDEEAMSTGTATAASSGITGEPTVGSSGQLPTTTVDPSGEPSTSSTGAPATTSTSTSATSTTSTSESTGLTASTTGDASSTGTSTVGTSSTTGGESTGEPMMDCVDLPANPAGPEVEMAPAFAEFYKTFDLGQVPGIPPASRLGGCVISNDDPNLLYIAGDSEAATGKVWQIKVIRGNCDHIVAFDGVAQPLADTPYVDANLVLIKSGLMFYTEWPVNRISQLLPGQNAPALTTDLAPLGVENSVSGIGFVPPGYADAGEFRILTWSGGRWYHLDRTPNGELYTLSNAALTQTIPNGPGGFAYVPNGSPGFMTDHVIVSEWSTNTVGVYEIDALGDPKPPTRKDFFTKFPRPWGAYFEPKTGDFMFLTWGAASDRVYIVQGFEPPPPIPQ